jgi:hypothetical protein
VEQVAADFITPVYADNEGEHSRRTCCDMLAGLGEAGHDGDHAKHWDEPQQALFVAGLLQVKAGNVGTEYLRPRQKEAHAQTDGAQVDQLRPAQTDGLVLLPGGSGRGFRFRCDGDFIGHNYFLLVVNTIEQNPVDIREDTPVDETRSDKSLVIAAVGAMKIQKKNTIGLHKKYNRVISFLAERDSTPPKKLSA